QRDLPLVLGAVAADPARHDLAAVGDEVLQGLRVLVIDHDGLVRAELVDLAAREAALAAAAAALTALAPLAAPAVLAVELDIGIVVAHGLLLPLLAALGGGRLFLLGFRL